MLKSSILPLPTSGYDAERRCAMLDAGAWDAWREREERERSWGVAVVEELGDWSGGGVEESRSGGVEESGSGEVVESAANVTI